MAKLSLKNPHCELVVTVDEKINPHIMRDRNTGQIYADDDYLYRLKLRSEKRVIECDGLRYLDHSLTVDEEGNQELVLRGNCPSGERTEVEVVHRFSIPVRGRYIEERITIVNCGKDRYYLEDMRFGFRRGLCPAYEPGQLADDISRFRLVAVPYRKVGISQDKGSPSPGARPSVKRQEYTMEDMIEGKFSNVDWRNDETVMGQDLVDRYRLRSEGWAWTDGRCGLLIVKYNDEMIEYSLVERNGYSRRECLVFGGVGFALYREPRPASVLEPQAKVSFGPTRYIFFDGGWKEAFYLFRDFMAEKGHGLPDGYNPPVNWNVLYDIGWYHSDREKLFKHYNLEALHREARKARDLGCELLYLDPGWEVCEGTTLWDEERLGRVEDLVRTLKEEYGLKLGYRTIGRVYRDEFPNEWYIQRSKEKGQYIRPIGSDGKPIGFWEPCTECREWWEEKLRRILAITGKGVKFMMFDEFDWRGPCFNPSHGHPVPSTPEGHVRAVYRLIEEVRRRCPEVLVEAHDPVWPWRSVRYVPTYWRQGEVYQENWGFEFMWDPLEDLLSGRALVLYYYNLAYSIPLYLHITMEGDNDNCLAFWWYASTVRHLGIGGKKGLRSSKENELRFQAYRRAMRTYLELKEFYVRGTFYGLDELIHVHTLPQRGEAVLNAFNLTDRPVSRTVIFKLEEVGLDPELEVAIEGAEWERRGSEIRFGLEIPAMSPILVRLNNV